jgi:hypothetical protein
MGKRQLDYAEERYHRLIAAVHHQYHIDERPSVPRQVSFVAPSQYHKVTFEAYKDRILESMEAAVDPRDRSPVYVFLLLFCSMHIGVAAIREAREADYSVDLFKPSTRCSARIRSHWRGTFCT